MASITSNYGLSKPLGSEAPDISVINDNMDTLDSELVVKTSNDIADATATKSTGWTTVLPVAVGEKVASVFEKFSTMAKNIRWIYKFLGTADISSIGDGTVTNALTTLNTAVGKKVNTADIVNNLTSTSTTQPLSANMGKALNDAITNVNNAKQDKLILVELNSNNGVFENGGYLKIGRLVLFDLTFTCQASTTGSALISGFPASSQNNKPFYGQQITDSPSSNVLSFRIYGGNLYPNLSIGAGRYHCYGTYISAS